MEFMHRKMDWNQLSASIGVLKAASWTVKFVKNDPIFLKIFILLLLESLFGPKLKLTRVV
jgi:hypothetical protein